MKLVQGMISLVMLEFLKVPKAEGSKDLEGTSQDSKMFLVTYSGHFLVALLAELAK